MPPESSYSDYMTVSFALISLCDTVYLLNGWEDSVGATAEYHYAKAMKKNITLEGCLDYAVQS